MQLMHQEMQVPGRGSSRVSCNLGTGIQGQLNISANGGNGGVNTAGFGNGGGGAGGLIWFSSASMPSSVPVATVAYGTIAPTNPQEEPVR